MKSLSMYEIHINANYLENKYIMLLNEQDRLINDNKESTEEYKELLRKIEEVGQRYDDLIEKMERVIIHVDCLEVVSK